MMDGWMLRHRGADWGLKPVAAAGERVAWQECKSAVIYHLRHAAKTAGDRGLLVEKFVVAHVGEPLEFGRRVQAEARRRGLGEAAAGLCRGGWRRVDLEHRGGPFCRPPPACWIFTTPASISGTWRTRCIPKMKRARGRGSNRCCTSCGTAAKPGCCKPCRTCRRGVRARAQALPPTVATRNQLFREASGTSALRSAGGRRLSRRQRRDGILVRPTARPLQTRRPVLDRTGPPPPHGPRSRPPQPRLA